MTATRISNQTTSGRRQRLTDGVEFKHSLLRQKHEREYNFDDSLNWIHLDFADISRSMEVAESGK
jgi:hypothetical protein